MRFLGIFLVFSMLTGCAAYRDPERRTVGEITDDTAVQARVKTRLLRDPELSGLRINVDVHKGIVSLYGPAPSAVVRDHATRLVRAVKGVREIHNQLWLPGESERDRDAPDRAAESAP